MELINIYTCFCDPTRLRILHLLCSGPLCVCHFQAILREPQVKISKHLGYLKAHGLVVVHRRANWRVYGLPEKINVELRKNLACLQDCAAEDPVFRRDLAELQRLNRTLDEKGPICGGAKPGARRRVSPA